MTVYINYEMIQQQLPFVLPKPTEYVYSKTNRSGNRPRLNKVEAFEQQLFCAYSNGLLRQYKYGQGERYFQLQAEYYPYQNTDIIDMDQFDSDVLLTCTHNEVTLFNLTKNKSIPLKGHETSPFAVSAHPVCPYVISISNAIIEHDIRMRRPINVNFITPPAYDVEFFQDGKDFVLSGEPCRIGRSKWVRSLLNGIAKPSINCKHVLTNDMNGSLSLWDWRESEQLMTIDNVKNLETFQPIHFGMREGTNTDILFLQDNGSLLKYDFSKQEESKRRSEYKVLEVGKNDNWKMTTRNVDFTTKSLIFYEHNNALFRVYDLN